jgi:hypothetical protein
MIMRAFRWPSISSLAATAEGDRSASVHNQPHSPKPGALSADQHRLKHADHEQFRLAEIPTRVAFVVSGTCARALP